MWRLIQIFSFAIFFIFAANVRAQQPEMEGTTEEVTTSTAPISTTTNQASVTVERHIITTEVPAPKVIVTAPGNSINCFKIEAGWHNDVWVPEHQICQYANSPEGVAWVEGYWVCTKFKAETGDCTGWDWRDAHWVKVLDVY